MTIHFSELRHPQVAAAAERGAVPVLPVGQVEEHGPHLPINTDLLIVRRLCEEAVAQVQGTTESYMLDPIAYGYSQQVLKRWPGTFVLPIETVIDTATHILISLADSGFRKVVVVNWHGNHPGSMRVAARKVADARGCGPALLFPGSFVKDIAEEHWKAGPGGSCHAGEMETSLMLYLAPELCDMSAAVSDDKITNLCDYPSGAAFVSTWTRQESESGTYGDPTVATAEFGKLLFDKMVAETAKFITYYRSLEQV